MLCKCTLNFNFISSSFLTTPSHSDFLSRLPCSTLGRTVLFMEHFMCTNKSTQGRHSFGSEMKEGKSRIFVERGHRKFDSVRRLSRSSSFLVCSFFYSSFSFAISFFFLRVGAAAAAGPRPLYLVAFFCHHRAYNSHFMSPLPLTLFFSVLCAAAVVWELRTQRYEFTNFMTPFFTHSPTDRRSVFFEVSSSLLVGPGPGLKTTWN